MESRKVGGISHSPSSRMSAIPSVVGPGPAITVNTVEKLMVLENDRNDVMEAVPHPSGIFLVEYFEVSDSSWGYPQSSKCSWDFPS